ncbi:MAG TPA: C4-type zinc ribbon domain-containing protein [bacterium]|jgi:predicted  nucleic acid-binding Zn-ribbon protein|nr:C4-type zinc ribbon domain-containing protein [bacterium]HNT66749.1 C4-type zinc ribbon domain-containing protein [bacterium]HOX87644.1 C4-type zinc ribbon domain-containing protein [bacterium]HPG44966.1 C4-type zinc ribbon domain-containing protein [bacterium]HPM99622.1 C4-type zinc ribbon domain-containing protein [bacterium]
MAMNDLERLVSLQDLDLMIQETDEVAKLGFNVTGYDELQKAREELANQISRPLLSRYERLRAKLKRAIVPVKNDICLGCFLRQPTSLAARGREDEEIFTCENCGRMLYWLD